jgi:hypothetical protein
MSERRLPAVYFRFPDYGDTESASDAQRRVLTAMLGSDVANVELGAEHAAVLISICNYLNSALASVEYTTDTSSMAVFASGVARDHALVEMIRAWGKESPRRRRASVVHKLDLTSEMYERVLTIMRDIAGDPVGYARSKLGPDIPRY